MTQPWTGGGMVIFQGNSGTPGNVVLSTTSANCVAVTCPLPGSLRIKDCELRTTTSGRCLYLEAPGVIEYSNVRFGSCAGWHIVSVGTGGTIKATGNYSIVGNAAIHAYAQTGQINIINVTVTLTGTPAFATAFAYATQLGFVNGPASTFSGSATGQRYNASLNAVISSGGGGANYFPGNSAGATGTGGQYA